MNVALKNNIPELRFLEFTEDWSKEPLEGYIELLSGFAFKGEYISENSKGIPLLRGINITEGYIRHSKDIDRYYEGNLDNLSKFILLENDLVLGMDGSKVGKNVALIEREDSGSLLIQRVARIRSNEKSNINYIYQNIFSLRFRRYVDKVNTSSGIPHISSKQIKEFKIGFPTPTEQTKIATFLTAVDKRINLLQKKKAELEQYKKGIMQKLFSQTLRFKNDDGSNFEDWEEKKLGEVCEKKSSNISANTLKDNSGEYKIFGASGYLQSIDFYREEEPYISIVKDGAGVGRTLLCEAKSSVLGTLDTIKPKDGNNLNFLYSLINQIQFTKYITGSTIPHIYFRDYSKEKVSIPKPKEQQKIANFLSSIDKSIEKMTNQIDDSVVFKKGLLQKMFV